MEGLIKTGMESKDVKPFAMKNCAQLHLVVFGLVKILNYGHPPRVALSSDAHIKFLLCHIEFSIISKVIHSPSSLVLPPHSPWVSILLPIVFNQLIIAPNSCVSVG